MDNQTPENLIKQRTLLIQEVLSLQEFIRGTLVKTKKNVAGNPVSVKRACYTLISISQQAEIDETKLYISDPMKSEKLRNVSKIIEN